MTRRVIFPLILFIVMVLSGVALELLPHQLLMGTYMIVPHWLFVMLIYIAIFYDRNDTYYAVLYALIFGLLFDIVYTGILGVYMFSYGLVIYIVRGLKKMLQGNFYVLLILSAFGIALADISIYTTFTVIGLADMPIEVYLLNRLVPTILLNLLFLVLIYPLIIKPMRKWGRELT
ncbi:rod shape-determining protein MreD [Oceanobacillus sp. CFH 90083]|uniref:rod shape-determining protein MreD n=1 Tax=Oceanobacillus sp. CFH 90083 TaxID=2592336 RepID=UPI00128DDCF3|nr:rod shape-determining protein MreD [Oceanobacillus sp. CFH 90083]